MIFKKVRSSNNHSNLTGLKTSSSTNKIKNRHTKGGNERMKYEYANYSADDTRQSHYASNEPLTSDFFRREQEPHYHKQKKVMKQRTQDKYYIHHHNRNHIYDDLAMVRQKKPPEVAEEYEIDSTISTLTRDSEFKVDDKENRRVSAKKKKKKNGKKKHSRHDQEDSNRKTSMFLTNFRLLPKARSRRDTSEHDQMTSKKDNHKHPVRTKSYSPDRSHAASLLWTRPEEQRSTTDYAQLNRHSHPSKTDEDLERYLHQKRSESVKPSRRYHQDCSPTRLAHPHIEYQMESARKIISPEPSGTRLEDFAFLTPRLTMTQRTNERDEPLGTRLDHVISVDTPMTVDVYVEDHPQEVPKSPVAKYSAESIHQVYQDLDNHTGVPNTYNGVDVEAVGMPGQTRERGNGVTNEAHNEFSSHRATHEFWVSNDTYAGRARARIRSRLQRSESSQDRNIVGKEHYAMNNVHDAPALSVDEVFDHEALSSFDIDKSDFLDWRVSTRYNKDKVALHRSKYRSLLPSSQGIDLARQGRSETVSSVARQYSYGVRRSRSTGELHRVSPETTKHDSLARSKEFLEFSPRETGGFLQATCFQESKSSNGAKGRRRSFGTSTPGDELDWMEIIADETATLKHNDSHELNIQKTICHRETRVMNKSKNSDALKEMSVRAKKTRKDKELIHAITMEASKQTLLSPSGIEDELSNVEEDSVAGLYPTLGASSTKIRSIPYSQRHDVVRQLPFPITPSPPKAASQEMEERSNAVKNPLDLSVAPVVMTTSQRKKLISEFLSARDGSAEMTPLAHPRYSSESSNLPPFRVRVQPRTEVHEAQQTFKSPSQGICSSKSSVLPSSASDPSSVVCLGGNVRRSSESSSLRSASLSSLASVAKTAELRDGGTVSGENRCFPNCNPRALNWCQYSRANKIGYGYLPSDEYSTASLVKLKGKTVSSKRTPSGYHETPSENNDKYIWSPMDREDNKHLVI